MTVAELLQRISSHELTEWMAFAELEPFGYEQEAFGHAMTAKTIADVNLGKDQKPYKIEDFMPKPRKIKEDKPKEQGTDDMIQNIEMLNLAVGGKDLRNHK